MSDQPAVPTGEVRSVADGSEVAVEKRAAVASRRAWLSSSWFPVFLLAGVSGR